MTTTHADEPPRQRPLRLWPGVVLVALQWLVGYVLPIFMPEAGAVSAMGALLCGVLIVVWWAFFSRAPGDERWGAVLLMVVGLVATRSILHESIRGGRHGLPVLPLRGARSCASPSLSGRWSAVASPTGTRRAAMVATILLACGVWTLVRTGGVTGSGDWDFAWRWSKTPEDRLLARAGDAAGWRRRRLRQQRLERPTGPVFADPLATASSAACGSRPTGPRRRRSSCGAGRSDRAGPPSRSAATCSTPRSSAATTSSSPATTRPPASRCGDTAMRPGSGSRRPAPVRAPRRPSRRASLHVRRDRNPERARRR